MQLMELAIINGTYRTNEQLQAAQLAMAQKLKAVRKLPSLIQASIVNLDVFHGRSLWPPCRCRNNTPAMRH